MNTEGSRNQGVLTWSNHEYIPQTKKTKMITLVQAPVIHEEPSSVGF